MCERGGALGGISQMESEGRMRRVGEREDGRLESGRGGMEEVGQSVGARKG